MAHGPIRAVIDEADLLSVDFLEGLTRVLGLRLGVRSGDVSDGLYPIVSVRTKHIVGWYSRDLGMLREGEVW